MKFEADPNNLNLGNQFETGPGQRLLSTVEPEDPFITHLQSGSVRVFGQPVAPPGGDNEGFIGVNLQGRRGSDASSDFRDEVTIRLGLFNIEADMLAWNLIMLKPHLVLCWERTKQSQVSTREEKQLWINCFNLISVRWFKCILNYLCFPSWPHCHCRTGTGSSLHSEAAQAQRDS